MRPIALALALLATSGCRSLLIRGQDPIPEKVAKFTARTVLVLPTLGVSELRMQAVALQERVEVSQGVLDYLYVICRDAQPGSDEARRACWDYQRGQEQHAQLLQAVYQWQGNAQQVGQQMQRQGFEQMQRGLHPEPPPAPAASATPMPAPTYTPPPREVRCTTAPSYGGYGPIETVCR
jgi:hypothetical protein